MSNIQPLSILSQFLTSQLKYLTKERTYLSEMRIIISTAVLFLVSYLIVILLHFAFNTIVSFRSSTRVRASFSAWHPN